MSLLFYIIELVNDLMLGIGAL